MKKLQLKKLQSLNGIVDLVASIDALIEEFNEGLGSGHIVAKNLVATKSKTEWLDTGSYTLNKAINYRGLGLPTGNLVEMYGESATGKSMMALHLIKNCIAKDGIAIYIDVEGSFDFDLAESIGIDLDKLLLVEPIKKVKGELVPLSVTDVFTRTEKYLTTIRKTYGADQLVVIIWDSLAGTNFEEDLVKDGPSATMGAPEKRIKHWIRRVRPLVNSSNTLWLIVNQVYSNITSTPTAEPLKTPGGKAVGFHSQIRIYWVSKKGKDGKVYDTKDNIVGARLHFKINKNRVGPPWKEGYTEFHFTEEGKPFIPYYSGYGDYLQKKGIIAQGKGRVTIGEDSYRSRKSGRYLIVTDMEKLVEEHPEVLEK